MLGIKIVTEFIVREGTCALSLSLFLSWQSVYLCQRVAHTIARVPSLDSEPHVVQIESISSAGYAAAVTTKIPPIAVAKLRYIHPTFPAISPSPVKLVREQRHVLLLSPSLSLFLSLCLFSLRGNGMRDYN